MAQLGAWILVCVAVAFLLRKHPIHAVCVVLVLWVAVPAVGGHVLTGLRIGPLAFHPATWLLFAILLVGLLYDPAPLVQAFSRHIYVFLVIIVFTVGAFLTSRVELSGGTRLMMDQLIGPAVLFWVIVAHAWGDRRLLLLLRNVVLATIAAESALTVVQKLLGRIIFYENDYDNLPWFHPLTFDRWMGTTDTPLVLSLAISVAAPLTLGLRRAWLRIGLLVLFGVGSVITQSRTGVVLMVLIVGFTIVRARIVLWARVLSSVAFGVAAYVVATSSLIQGIASRLSNDTGSTQARLLALRFLYEHWSEFLATGQGLTSSYNIAQEAGLQTSIESAYLMYVVDTGAILATLYFGSQLCLLLRHGRQLGIAGAALSAGLGVALQHTFSSIAGTNLSGTMIWTALGLLVVGTSLSPLYAPAHSAVGHGVVPESSAGPPPVLEPAKRSRVQGQLVRDV